MNLNIDKLKDPQWLIKAIGAATATLVLGPKASPALVAPVSELISGDSPSVRKLLVELYAQSLATCVSRLRLKTYFKAQSYSVWGNLSLEAFDVRFPDQFPLYSLTRKAGLAKVDPAKRSAAELATADEAFRETFSRLLYHIDKYKPIILFIEKIQPATKSDPQTLYARHLNGIRDTIALKRLKIDDEITLSQIYVNMRAILKVAGYHSVNQAFRITSEAPQVFESRNGKWEGDFLEMACFIIQHPSSFKTIVLLGEPGHGKTSTAHVLVAALDSLESKHMKSQKVLIEFREIEFRDDQEIEIQIAKKAPFFSKDFLKGCKTLLVLDGMDEWHGSSETATKEVPKLLVRLHNFIEDCNKMQNTVVNLVLTGRTKFFELIQPHINFAIFELELQDFRPDHERSEWLNKYEVAHNLEPGTVLSQISKFNLEQLTQQPILLMIASRLLTDPQGQQILENEVGKLRGLEIQSCDIFRAIVRWTYEKKWHPNRNLFKSGNPDAKYNWFSLALYVIAFAIWKRFGAGTKSISLKELKASVAALEKLGLIYENDYGERLIPLTTDQSFRAFCEEILISFYFGKSGSGEYTFEFFHQQLQDYLLGDGICTLLRLAAELPIEQRKNAYAYLLSNCLLSGQAHLEFIENYVATFSGQAILLYFELESFYKEIRQFRSFETLTKPEFGNQITQYGILLCNVIGLLSQLRMADPAMRKLWSIPAPASIPSTSSDLKNLILLLNGCGLQGEIGQLFNCRNLDLSRRSFDSVDLRGIDWSGVDFRGASLENANLSYAKMIGACLEDANLSGAKLKEADLSESYCSKAKFNYANLREARLLDANLRDASFIGANLNDINLKGAELNRTDFSYATVDLEFRLRLGEFRKNWLFSDHDIDHTCVVLPLLTSPIIRS